MLKKLKKNLENIPFDTVLSYSNKYNTNISKLAKEKLITFDNNLIY